jgi:hypothetical protein
MNKLKTQDLIAQYAKEGKAFRRSALPITTEVDPDSRTAVHKITSATLDREFELVYPDAFIFDQYNVNPVVLFNHEQDRPVGKSLWIKAVGDTLVMKTKYPRRPDSLHPSESFEPDRVFALISCDPPVLAGASVGYIPLEMRPPTPEECEKYPGVERVTTKALLLEVSMVSVPCNPEAVLQSVTKGLIPMKVIGHVKKRKPIPKKLGMSYVAVDLIDHEAIARRVADKYLGRI